MPVPSDEERVRRRAAALAWVNTHWKTSHACPICKSDSWSISDVFEWREFTGGDLFVGGSTQLFPMFPLTCTVCAFTYTFNAVISGIVGQKDATTPAPSTPTDPPTEQAGSVNG